MKFDRSDIYDAICILLLVAFALPLIIFFWKAAL